MIIVTQERDELLNFEAVQTISQRGCHLRAEFESDLIALGEYADEERAKRVLEDIANRYAGPETDGGAAYWMPEK